MGQASLRAALIYQHATRERDVAIAPALSKQIAKGAARAAKRKRGDIVRSRRPPDSSSGFIPVLLSRASDMGVSSPGSTNRQQTGRKPFEQSNRLP